ncbi:unnamed protein product [Rhizopus stolonifer]
MNRFGVDWLAVSKEVKCRTEHQCLLKWNYQKHTLLGKFSKEEDEEIIKLVGLHGSNNFRKIKKEMDTHRTEAMLRERYQNYLDPSLDKSPWTKEEEAEFIKLYRELGNIDKVKRSMTKNRSKRSLYNRTRKYIIKKMV